MKLIRLSDTNVRGAVAEAASVIFSGGIVAFPTETFYALGARYNDQNTLARLYEIKRRSRDKALPLILGNVGQIPLVALSLNPAAEKLIGIFWPGPLTILVPALPSLPELITGGTGKAAVRIPGKSFALDLAQALPFPITSTSANISGAPPADNPADIVRYFGDGIDLLIDGGKTPGGRPSTIIDILDRDIKIIREGVISESEILRAI